MEVILKNAATEAKATINKLTLIEFSITNFFFATTMPLLLYQQATLNIKKYRALKIRPPFKKTLLKEAL